MNSIRNFLGGGPISGLQALFQNVGDLMNKFNRFRQDPIREIMSMNNVNVPKDFHGTPEELGRYLLNSGQMSQADFQSFANIANQKQNPFNRF